MQLRRTAVPVLLALVVAATTQTVQVGAVNGFVTAIRHAESQGNAANRKYKETLPDNAGFWAKRGRNLRQFGNFFKKIGNKIAHAPRAADGTLTDVGKAQLVQSVTNMPQEEKLRFCGNMQMRVDNPNLEMAPAAYAAGGSAGKTLIAISPLRRTQATAAIFIVHACRTPVADAQGKYGLSFPPIQVWPEIREKLKSVSEAANSGWKNSRSYIRKIVTRYANPVTGRFRRGTRETQNIRNAEAERLITAMETAYDQVVDQGRRKRFDKSATLPANKGHWMAQLRAFYTRLGTTMFTQQKTQVGLVSHSGFLRSALSAVMPNLVTTAVAKRTALSKGATEPHIFGNSEYMRVPVILASAANFHFQAAVAQGGPTAHPFAQRGIGPFYASESMTDVQDFGDKLLTQAQAIPATAIVRKVEENIKVQAKGDWKAGIVTFFHGDPKPTAYVAPGPNRARSGFSIAYDYGSKVLKVVPNLHACGAARQASQGTGTAKLTITCNGETYSFKIAITGNAARDNKLNSMFTYFKQVDAAAEAQQNKCVSAGGLRAGC